MFSAQNYHLQKPPVHDGFKVIKIPLLTFKLGNNSQDDGAHQTVSARTGTKLFDIPNLEPILSHCRDLFEVKVDSATLLVYARLCSLPIACQVALAFVSADVRVDSVSSTLCQVNSSFHSFGGEDHYGDRIALRWSPEDSGAHPSVRPMPAYGHSLRAVISYESQFTGEDPTNVTGPVFNAFLEIRVSSPELAKTHNVHNGFENSE